MSNLEMPVTTTRRKGPFGIRGAKTHKPRIVVDNEEWGPRPDLAAEIGVCARTIELMNFPTVLIGRVAYVNFTAAKREIVAQARRRVVVGQK
jgi:hypothetical protein